MISSRLQLAFSLILLVLLTPALAGRQAPARVGASAEAITLNNLGVASMNQQKLEVALERFEAASRADGSLVAARVNQAIAMTALQRYEPAQQILDAIVKADPANLRAWYNLGLLARTLGDSDAAMAAFTRATELAPNDPYAHYFVGLISSQLQQHDKAILSFTRAIELDPFLVSAEFGIARSYQRSGKTGDAKTHMDRFTRLTQEKVASAMSLSYGDQGPLSLAQAVQPLAGAAPPAIAVKFVGPNMAPPHAVAENGVASGVCLIDADGDGAIDYLRLDDQGAQVMRNDGKGQFTPGATLKAASPVACATGDYDNDEKPDIAIASAAGVWLFRNAGDGGFDIAAPMVVKNGPGAVASGVSFVDFDHDADLDVIATRVPSGPGASGAAPVMLRNNGDGTFADVTVERGLAGLKTVGVTASDLNNDRAIDLVFTGTTVSILINPREGVYRSLDAFTSGGPANTRGVVAFDFDKDGWMDLAFTHFEAPVSLWRNIEGKSFERVTLPAPGLFSGFGLTAIDYDNDGWIDLAAAGYAKAGGYALQVLRNVEGRFEDASAAVGVGALAASSVPLGLVAGDLDGDNDADLLLTSRATGPVLLRNDGGNANNAVRIALLGLNDNRSGIGTKVEVQAGTVWQKFETVSATGFAGQGSPEILAGIGKATEADVVRLLWPTGVVQDEVELKANTRHAITQIDRRGSSCPILFSWNGTTWEFVSDSIGPAVVGHWVAPGEYNAVDTDEYVKVAGQKLKPRDGVLSLHFTEPMEEINYLDQVRLVAIDHPAGTEVYPNEYFASSPPWPAARTIATRGSRLPIGAWDERGRDVLPALRARDRRFVDSFSNAPFKGFATPHALELDLGALDADAPVRLLMHGFTDYFTATSMYAAHQAGVAATAPYVEAQLPDGRWRKVVDDIGFPAGLLRTMVADLTGKLPAGTRRIRIWTNLKIYWDQVLVDTTPDGAIPVRRTEVPLSLATLSQRGYPREMTGRPVADIRYRFDEVSATGPYARHRGFYTRYGEITPLLRASEDHFVIFGSGDDVAIDFDARQMPPVPEGWTRDYEVYLNGFVKDMDFYGAHSQTVSPLPFKAMPAYPYPDSVGYPDTNLEYQLEWNTREVSSESSSSYRFDYRAVP